LGQLIAVGTSTGFDVLPADGCGAATCSVAWSRVGAGRFGDAIAISNGTIFTASDGGLEAYPAAGCGVRTCTPAWRAAGNFGALAIGHGFVFLTGTISGNSTVITAIPETGAATCRAAWTSSGFKVYSAPSVANGVVYAGALDGSLQAWPAAGCGANVCSAAWSTTVPDPVSNPTVADGRLCVPSLTLRTFAVPPT
jgi:hypothetical protein